MVASDTPENFTNSTSDSAAALIATQYPAHADGVPIVAVIGGGQLAHMMQTGTVKLGQFIHLLAGFPDASMAQVCVDAIISDYHIWEDVERTIAGAQAVTFDHKYVPTESLNKLTEMGYSVQPQPSALLYVQDKLLMHQRLEELGTPVSAYAAIESVRDAGIFPDRVDGAVCLKACRSGYGGHGVWFPKDRENLHAFVDEPLGKGMSPTIGREVTLVRGLSAICAYTLSGKVKAWPVPESVQRDGICIEAICPAPGPSDELVSAAGKLSVAIVSELRITGAPAVELLETVDADNNSEIFVNGLAMRPYNTGHWSQGGCKTSQFEQHLRAVADLPLGSARPIAPATVMANTPDSEETSDVPTAQRFAEARRRLPSVRTHWYRRDWRPGRKLGHVNLYGYDASPEDIAGTRRAANLAAGYIVDGVWTNDDPANDVQALRLFR